MIRRSPDRMRRAIEVARLHCDTRALQPQAIDEELHLPKGTASHLLKYARTLGLLTVRTDLPMPLDREIGSKLGRRFAPARILAVDTSSPMLPEAPGRGPDAEDDHLHEMLGVTAAQYLGRRLRHYDLVGVGAGRAIFHAARALMTFPGGHLLSRRITVFGLHGQVDRRLWRPTSRYALQSIDAVRVTHTLANALPRARALPLMLPLVQETPGDVREALKGPAAFLTHEEWKRRPPSMALVGVGVMGGPPAIRGESGRVLASRPADTRPIKHQRLRLKMICRSFFTRHSYIPVSDVCDRLFWVPDEDVARPMRREANPLLEEINEHLLTVETGMPPWTKGLSGKSRPGSLDQVQEIVVVAGGQHKVRALRRLLEQRRSDGERRFMDTLITDVKTAITLLGESQGRPSAGGAT